VAEGIEHHEQLERLLRLGCELGQGFYFARPMDATALEALLERKAPLPHVPAATSG
jgi:EAL domain-containing protein (putative c-di-GMP-specific phosphodiesterase class I)